MGHENSFTRDRSVFGHGKTLGRGFAQLMPRPTTITKCVAIGNLRPLPADKSPMFVRKSGLRGFDWRCIPQFHSFHQISRHKQSSFQFGVIQKCESRRVFHEQCGGGWVLCSLSSLAATGKMKRPRHCAEVVVLGELSKWSCEIRT